MTLKLPISSDRPGGKPGSVSVADGSARPLPSPPDLAGIAIVPLHPQPPVADYRAAMRLADTEAAARAKDYMLLS